MSNDNLVNKYANFISNQLIKEAKEGATINEDTAAQHAMSPKVAKYASEPVSKSSNHEIRFTGGDDNDMHYHGHVNGKKFTATSEYVGDNDDEHEETKRVKNDLSKGLKAHGIQGADHDLAMKHIMKHAKKEINDTYHGSVHEEIKMGIRPQIISEDKEYAMDYDEPKRSQINALAKAHKHITAKGYKVSHEGSDDPKHKEMANPDITYHYAMGDDMHHAFTVHDDGKAKRDAELHKIAKPLNA